MSMKMAAFLSSLIVLAIAAPAAAQTLHFKTEAYPPYNYREGKEYRGTSVEQLQRLMEDVPASYTLELVPWARAYSAALHEPMNCAFTTAHTPERDSLFKWVEPLLIDRIYLVARRNSDIAVNSLAQAKHFIVGTQRSDHTYTLLWQMHFDRIDLASDVEVTLGKLLGNRIDLMPMSQNTYYKLRREGVGIEAKVKLSEVRYAIACHKDVPDTLIAQIQAALDKLIASGGQAEIFRKYEVEPGH